MKILFICDEQPVKRKLASRIARHFAGTDFSIHMTKASFDPTDHYLDKILHEVEFDSSKLEIFEAEDSTKERFDLIIALQHKTSLLQKDFTGFPPILYWPVKSPLRKGASPSQLMNALRLARDEIVCRIKHLLEDGYIKAFDRNLSWLDGLFNDESKGYLKYNGIETIIDANDEICKLTGYSKEELIGRPLRFIIMSDVVGRLAQEVMEQTDRHTSDKINLRKNDDSVIRAQCSFKGIPGQGEKAGLMTLVEVKGEETLISVDHRVGGMDRLNWDLVEKALEQSGGSRTRAARLLGVGRATFYRFLDLEKTKGNHLESLRQRAV